MSATRRAISRLGQTFLFEAEGDIGLDIEVRKQRVALKHHVDGAPIGRHRRKIDPIEQNAAGASAARSPRSGAITWSCRSPRVRAGQRTRPHKYRATDDRPPRSRRSAWSRLRCAAADAGSDRSTARNLVSIRRSAFLLSVAAGGKISRAFVTQIQIIDKCGGAAVHRGSMATRRRRQSTTTSVSDAARLTSSTLSPASLRGSGP